MNIVEKVWRKKSKQVWRKKKANKLCRVSKEDTRQKMCLSSVSIERSTKTNLCLTQALSIGNERQLPSATDALPSDLLCQEFGLWQRCLCRVPFYADCSALGTTLNAECFSLPSVTLDKMFFADCDKLPSAKR
jgi:hypothetical protein